MGQGKWQRQQGKPYININPSKPQSSAKVTHDGLDVPLGHACGKVLPGASCGYAGSRAEGLF